MKAIKFLAFGIVTVAIQGCYTVIWTPDVAFPTKGQSDNSESYYDEPYYGEYYPYYEMPWWYSVSPPQRLIIPASERTAQETKTRNGSSSDRGTDNSHRPIIETGSPTREQQTTTEQTTTDNSSTKKSESTTPPREQGNTTNSRDTRNNDGSRSSDPPRR